LVIAVEIAPQELSSIIGSIYDCVLEPAKWETVLAQIRDLFVCHSAVLTLSDTRHDRLLLDRRVALTEALPDKHLSDMYDQLSMVLSSWPSMDKPLVLARDMPTDYMATSAYVQDVLRPSGIVDIMQYFLIGSPQRFAGLTLFRREPQQTFSDQDLALSGSLLPHIRRAVTISDLLEVRAIERARFAAALDALRCAVILTDASGRIVHANHSAEQMLHEGTAITTKRNQIGAVRDRATREIREAIKFAAADDFQIGKAGAAIRLSEDDTSPTLAHVLPLAGTEFRRQLEPGAVAAVFIRNREDAHDNAELLATTYALTPAETRVLACLVAGRSLAATASELRVSTSTVRTHLDVIFRKTGVGRQAELMLLVSQLSPPVKS
jgi:DNA-binding CsgD family transcriptional regulator